MDYILFIFAVKEDRRDRLAILLQCISQKLQRNYNWIKTNKNNNHRIIRLCVIVSLPPGTRNYIGTPVQLH